MKHNLLETPWTFDGEVFDGPIDKLHGFVYIITYLPTGQKYIGKKSFWQMRKPKGAKRRKKSESDWKKYWSSSDTIKALVKEFGPSQFSREIISLHELSRDVNYCEVRMQWHLNVLEEVDSSGQRVYLNENIAGKWFPGLYIDWKERSRTAKSAD